MIENMTMGELEQLLTRRGWQLFVSRTQDATTASVQRAGIILSSSCEPSMPHAIWRAILDAAQTPWLDEDEAPTQKRKTWPSASEVLRS
jgi:hypothetical protein